MFDEPSSSGTGSFMGGLNSALGDTAGYGKGSGSALPVPPAAAAPPPMFGAQGTTPGKRPGKKPGGTFMGSAALTPAPSNLGSNTLLGQ